MIPQNMPSVGQKKLLETQGPPSRKKQKILGAHLDQSIEQLNDVTTVAGVNLREEEKLLLSYLKEESRASETTQRVVREEEGRLILQKGPLKKKLVEIMSQCGIRNISTDVECCLSLCVEKRLRGLMSNLIRVSRQRVDVEKAKHQIVFTADVRHQILIMNKKAKEEWEKKQAEEAEKLHKQNESTLVEDDKMRTIAANIAVQAAVGGEDMLLKWKLMAEKARKKCECGLDMVSGAIPGRTTTCMPLSNFGGASRENRVPEREGPSVVSAAVGMSKFGRTMPHLKAVRSIPTKDVIAILEREPQTTKSSLVYRLYERKSCNSPAE